MSNIKRRAAGTKQAGVPVGGQFAAHEQSPAAGAGLITSAVQPGGEQEASAWQWEKSGAGSPAPASVEEKDATRREWQEAQLRREAYFTAHPGASDIDWLDQSRTSDGAVRLADWRLAMYDAWQAQTATPEIDHRYPTLRGFMRSGHAPRAQLAAECKTYAAAAFKHDKQSQLGLICQQYAQHGTMHESDIPLSHRADELNTRIVREGVDDDTISEASRLARDAEEAAHHGELPDNAISDLSTLADTFEDENFHSESVALEAIVALDHARKNPDSPLTNDQAWALASGRIDTPADVLARAERDQPVAHRRGVQWAEHRREAFEV